jgi:hypothetical protein
LGYIEGPSTWEDFRRVREEELGGVGNDKLILTTYPNLLQNPPKIHPASSKPQLD